MEKCAFNTEVVITFISSYIIVAIGVTLHLNEFSVVEKQPIQPNAASVLTVCSLVGIFAKMRPLLRGPFTRMPGFLMYMVELPLILLAIDILMRYVWMPFTELLEHGCLMLAEHIGAMETEYLFQYKAHISRWLRQEGVYTTRFLVALVIFLYMITMSRVMKFLFKRGSKSTKDNGAEQSGVKTSDDEIELDDKEILEETVEKWFSEQGYQKDNEQGDEKDEDEPENEWITTDVDDDDAEEEDDSETEYEQETYNQLVLNPNERESDWSTTDTDDDDDDDDDEEEEQLW